MSKVVKAVFSIPKKIFKGVKKVFKKVISSKLGKVLLIAAAVYTGGVLMGAWGSGGPLSSIYGAWGQGAAGVGTGTSSAITSAAPALTPEIATSTTMAAGGGGAITAETLAAKEALLGAKLATSGAGGVGAATTPGFLAKAGTTLLEGAKSVGAFAKANPMATAIISQGIASATSPDEIDIMNEQDEMRKRRFAALSDVGSVNTRLAASGQTLTDLEGVPWHQRLRRG